MLIVYLMCILHRDNITIFNWVLNSSVSADYWLNVHFPLINNSRTVWLRFGEILSMVQTFYNLCSLYLMFILHRDNSTVFNWIFNSSVSADYWFNVHFTLIFNCITVESVIFDGLFITDILLFGLLTLISILVKID